MEYTVIVPVYNEHESLTELCDRFFNVFQSLGKAEQFEILIVDDGSTDSSKEVIKRLCAERRYVKGMFCRKNMGKSFAIMVGFVNSDSDYVVTIDADLQNTPEDLPSMIRKINEGYDLVCGWRQKRQDSYIRILGSHLFNYVVSHIAGLRLHDINCGFKVYRAKVIKNISVYGQYHRFIPLLAHLMGFKVTELAISHIKRKYGSSKYSVFRYQSFFDLLSILFTYRYRFSPLYFFGLLGFISIIPSFAVIIFIIYKHALFVLGLGENYLEKVRLLLPLSISIILLGMQIFLTGFVCDFILYHQNKVKLEELMGNLIER